MSTRPKIFLLLSCAYLMIAIGMPLQVVAIYGHGLGELAQIAGKLTILNWIVMTLAVVVAVLLSQVSPWLKYSVPAAILVVGLNNYIVGLLATDFAPGLTALATVAFSLLNTPLLIPRMRALILQPHQRWWLTKPRKQIELPVKISGLRLKSLRSGTFDISESGLFVPLPEDDEWWTELNSSGVVRLSLALSANTHLRCSGKIARVTQAKGRYPAGVGIQFVDLDRASRRQLRERLQNL